MNIFRIVGDLSHLLAIIVLIIKIWKTRSCAGRLAFFTPRILSTTNFTLVLAIYYIFTKNSIKFFSPILDDEEEKSFDSSFQFFMQNFFASARQSFARSYASDTRRKNVNLSCVSISFRNQWQITDSIRHCVHHEIFGSSYHLYISLQFLHESCVYWSFLRNNIPHLCEVQSYVRSQS